MRGGDFTSSNSNSNRNSQFTNYNSSNRVDNENNDSLKYSKEYMLSLYKSVNIPANIKHHEYVATEDSQLPLSFGENSVIFFI